MAKYIVVVGSVISGNGKGIAAASIGHLLKARGLNIDMIKFDPYLNVNAGIIKPDDHGEVFVCNDGSEVDLDLGSYERLAGIEASSKNICTSGTLYKHLITEQENGKYLGQTVQIIPHLTDLIQERLIDLGKDKDVVIVEIGGTVGDNESFAFYESVRQLKQKRYDDVLIVMIAPILWMGNINEFKTKPLQNGVKELQQHGLQPDIMFCRVDNEVPSKLLDKISMLTNIKRECIFDAPHVSTVYQVPIEFYNRQVDDLFVDLFRFKRGSCRIHKYKELVEKITQTEEFVKIGVFGKYENSNEAYLSLKEALIHAGAANSVKIDIQWFNAEQIEKDESLLSTLKLDAIIVPGGFDNRGVEGKIKVIKHARENKIPFLGICLGLQCAVIEFARHVCQLNSANSLEFDKNTKYPVVHFVEGQEKISKKSGTMRLGSYSCELPIKNSLAYEIYGKKLINERHRHRYEVNPEYEDVLGANGLFVSGKNPETKLIEIMELDRNLHPFFIGTQAHPEFKSKLLEAAPLFKALVQAAKKGKYD